MAIGKRMIEIAIEKGATLAGIASMEALTKTGSHTIYKKLVNEAGIDTVKDVEGLPDNEFLADDQALEDIQLFTWPDAVKSVLVIGLAHPEDHPELDWWDGRGTLGNRIMIDIVKRTAQQIENDLKVITRKLHYYVEKGGIFLKDAAVLAGFGCIGKNNLLITPSNGPRIRLRALFIEAKIPPTGPIDFDPCATCKVHCRRVCPENAMGEKSPIFNTFDFSEPLPGRDGTYSRKLCNIRMKKDVAVSANNNSGKQSEIKFCRMCELVCPAGKRQDGKNRNMVA